MNDKLLIQRVETLEQDFLRLMGFIEKALEATSAQQDAVTLLRDNIKGELETLTAKTNHISARIEQVIDAHIQEEENK